MAFISVYRISPPVVSGNSGRLEILLPDCYIGAETSREFGLRRNEVWELLETSGITPKRVITSQERKALADGHAAESLSDPVRLMFIEKKTSQLLRHGIGLAELNRRAPVTSEKDPSAPPDDNDIRQFLAKVEAFHPKILAFVTGPDIFVRAFQSRFPGLTGIPGRQQFQMSGSEVWLLGSTTAHIRGAPLTAQEDLFFALGERISALREEAAT